MTNLVKRFAQNTCMMRHLSAGVHNSEITYYTTFDSNFSFIHSLTNLVIH